ncbi:hypothetical protein [Rhizobium sp. Rhizsp82]|jgi:hypothetical protein|uniref:hypothetical protein n=1 Tax=Rhizobium sp. Rhizsp82 TaxID=3243057 RepID=UPI0039B40557
MLQGLCANVFPKVIIKRFRLLRSVTRVEKFFRFSEGCPVFCYNAQARIAAEMCSDHPHLGLIGTAAAGIADLSL